MFSSYVGRVEAVQITEDSVSSDEIQFEHTPMGVDVRVTTPGSGTFHADYGSYLVKRGGKEYLYGKDSFEARYSPIQEDKPWLGIWTGMVDTNGDRVNFGDTLEFDPREWGNDVTNTFVVDLVNGDTICLGSTSSLAEHCTIIKRYSEQC